MRIGIPREAKTLEGESAWFPIKFSAGTWRESGPLRAGLNIDAGTLVHAGVKAAIGAE